MYNMTILQNATTVSDLVVYSNTISRGIVTGMFVIALFFIILMVNKKQDFDKVLAADSFICFVISTLLFAAHMINFMFPLFFLSVTAITVLYLYSQK